MEPANTATADLVAFLNSPTRVIQVRLAKNTFEFELDALALEDFVECDFPGYAAKVSPEFLPDTPESEAHGNAVTEMLTWVADGITNAQTITAVYVVCIEGAVTKMLEAYILDQPQTISADGHAYSKRVRVESVNVE